MFYLIHYHTGSSSEATLDTLFRGWKFYFLWHCLSMFSVLLWYKKNVRKLSAQNDVFTWNYCLQNVITLKRTFCLLNNVQQDNACPRKHKRKCSDMHNRLDSAFTFLDTMINIQLYRVLWGFRHKPKESTKPFSWK